MPFAGLTPKYCSFHRGCGTTAKPQKMAFPAQFALSTSTRHTLPSVTPSPYVAPSPPCASWPTNHRGRHGTLMQLAEGLDGDPIVIPTNDRLTALIGVLPLQLIAYELALLKGINPDTPRNLAKVCTHFAVQLYVTTPLTAPG